MDGAHNAEERKEGDLILEPAIQYVQNGTYPPSLSKDKKRAVRKRAVFSKVWFLIVINYYMYSLYNFFSLM